MPRRFTVPPRGPAAQWAGDAGVLMLAQAIRYAVPLATAPLLTRRLGVEGYGAFAVALAAATLWGALPAYGFGLTLPRTLAQATPDARGRLVAASAAVRMALGTLAVAAAAATAPLLPASAQPLIGPTLAVIAAQALSWSVVFEGVGRFRSAAALFAISRAPVPLLVWLWVRQPGDAAAGLYAFALCSAAETLVGAVLARRAGLLRSFARADVRAVMRGSGALFAGQVALLAYVSGNAVWMAGAGVGLRDVGRFAAAEQVARAATGLLQPAMRAFLPRLSQQPLDAQTRWVRRALPPALGLGASLGLGLFVGAPVLPHWLGADFAASVEVVRWMAPLPVLVALSQVVGVQRLVARGADRLAALLFGTGALGCVAGALWVAPRTGAVGMALSVVAAEAAVAVLAVALLRRHRPPAVSSTAVSSSTRPSAAVPSVPSAPRPR